MEILELLKNPLDLKDNKLFLIERALEKYPYFQPLHLLQTKAMQGAEESVFLENLQKTATYCGSRKILYDYLFYQKKENGEAPAQLEVEESEEKIIQNPILEEAQMPKKEQILAIEQPEESKKEYEKIPQKSELLFNQWLKANKKSELSSVEDKINDKSHKKTFQEKNQNSTEPEGIQEKLKIINEFLEKSPKIKPSEDYKPSPIKLKQDQNMSHLMTETLAKIYVEQKKYDKAITAYNILRLKYPEKSGFFADQIKLIKELKNN
ncbi:hypothetical protein EDL98_01995 [Ornithobacterium rhinotracheale]|uniref:hypothetical protein n=1 Tax=Ornithobacterium rhinotracheale TaxID=28251 RepID=UPI00129C80DB|nr:hypothetical protein [Ornithobacterium rhinotracheale]MRJ09863.1 hypothetical protein [Ornithobacterium rhinotracheale]